MTQLGLRPLPAATPGLEAAVGSLPGCFRLTGDTSGPHAAWVTGGPGWQRDVAAALAAGALAVALDTTGPVDAADLAGFADSPVLLVGSRTHAPQLRALAAALPDLGEPELVDLLVVDGGQVAPDPRAALWDAAAILTAAGLDLDSVPLVTLGRRVVVAQARVGAALVHLTCLHHPGSPPRAVLKVFAGQRTVQATMADPLVADPGELLLVGTDDARLAATRYLTPRRVALADLHAAAGRPPAPDLLARHMRVGDLLARVAWPPRVPTASPQLEGRSR